MNQPSSDPGGDIDREIDKVASLITMARRHLAEDRMVDLSALEGKVRVLCASIVDSPPEDADQIMTSVKAMIENLELLARELTAQQVKLGSKAEGIERRRATQAYAKTKKDNT